MKELHHILSRLWTFHCCKFEYSIQQPLTILQDSIRSPGHLNILQHLTIHCHTIALNLISSYRARASADLTSRHLILPYHTNSLLKTSHLITPHVTSLHFNTRNTCSTPPFDMRLLAITPKFCVTLCIFVVI